ncbi:MAG: GH3 auxin-responsive promoter family protein, partial [Bacteroidota bacterium]
EQLSTYIESVKHGEHNVLWPDLPTYFCKTSGTTSGTKYIPLTRDSIPNHIDSAKNALLNYIGETKNSNFVNGKMIFLQGSPELEKLPSGIPFGRLSGIVANHVPSYLQKNRMPAYETNCIADWETKVKQIVVETSKENMTLISGIPAWVQMYFEMLLDYTGKKTVLDVFPNFELFPFGGVSFEPYAKRMAELIGKEIPKIELYPASEGFLAYQDSQTTEGLRLNVNSGIFFEFIRADDYFSNNPKRYSLAEVEIGINYALILSNNAGLWGYSIGDTVKFVSTDPYRIVVTGRIKHFTSAFGEHVIAEEVEKAMAFAQKTLKFTVQEFHVAPQVNPTSGLPYHEWFIEFNETCENSDLESLLDNKMQEQNVYYRDLIEGKVLRPLKITRVKKGGFTTFMKSQGKLGGQNKTPRLANDRTIADKLETE